MAVLSERVRDLRASPVRAMLEASMRPEMISFAGGLPDAESFRDLELAAPPEWLPSNFISGPKTMPLRFKAR